MVKLSDNRPTKTVSLPNYPGSEVIVYKEFTVWDQRELQDTTTEESQFTKSLKMILRCIKSWNFSDDDEGKVPSEINLKNLWKIRVDDLYILLEAISGKNKKELLKIWAEMTEKDEKKN